MGLLHHVGQPSKPIIFLHVASWDAKRRRETPGTRRGVVKQKQGSSSTINECGHALFQLIKSHVSLNAYNLQYSSSIVVSENHPVLFFCLYDYYFNTN